MEQFPGQDYRDELTKDLRGIRNSEEVDGKKMAQNILNLSKGTEQYAKAREGNLNRIKNYERSNEGLYIEKLFDLIKKSPNFNFYVSANGVLRGPGKPSIKNHYDNGSLRGQYDYCFDKESSEMMGDRAIGLDDSGGFDVSSDNFVSFQEYFKIETRKDGVNNFLIIIMRIPFNPVNRDNGFTIEDRPGTHLSFALSVFEKSDIIEKELVDTPDIMRLLTKDRESDEAHVFFKKLFEKCAKEFIPEYWNFYLEQRGLADVGK